VSGFSKASRKAIRLSDRTRLLGLIVLVIVLSAAVSGFTSYLTIEYMSATYGKQSVSTITKTVGVIAPSGGLLWQLDSLASGSSVGSASCGLNSTFGHRADVAIVIIVYSTQSLPSSIEHTSEMTLSLLSSYNAVGSISPPNQPSVAIYGGAAATANATGNFNASFSSNQGTCLIIAMSWTFPSHSNFTFNNYVTGTTWTGATSLQVTMGADTNTNRLCLFFASIYGQGGEPTATNGSGLTVLQTVGSYQASSNNSISAQIGYVVSASSQTETMTANTSVANGILYPYVAINPS
jgi:hypothetical protein